MAHRGLQQGVPGRVEFDFVDPVAARVMAAQDRRVLVRQPRLLLGFPGAGQAAELMQLGGGPRRALAAERGEQRGVVGDVMPASGATWFSTSCVRYGRQAPGKRPLSA